MSRTALLAPPLLLFAVWACGPEDGSMNGSGHPDAGPAGDPDAAIETPPDAALQFAWEFGDVFGVPNLDDDDGLGPDWDQPPFPEDDDISIWVLPGDKLDLLPAGHRVQLELSGDLDMIRIYRNGQLILGDGAGPGPYAFQPPGGDVELQVEFGDWLAAGTVHVSELGLFGGELKTHESLLLAAPALINHHLQPTERVWAVRVNGNPDFIEGLSSVLGSRFTEVPGSQYNGDVWIQDEIELATMVGQNEQRMDLVIDSIRNRGLAPFARNALVQPGTIAETWGWGQANTLDAFGNLEASPPVTVGGTHFPFGRIYYGRTGNWSPHPALIDFLESQKAQDPFYIPTHWLCVAHVDEFTSFVPDPSSPKGFKFIFADVPSAYQLLASLDPDQPLPLYEADKGYRTVGEILNDPYLLALNQDLQEDYLDPILMIFKQELALTDDDIIKVPALFEEACGQYVAAMIPGTINLLSATIDETTHLFMPDPFFRQYLDQSLDPVIADFASRMPAGLELHFLNNWHVYHLGLGEVHCGTNSRRTPIDTWWTSATHLLGGN